jgi:beta-lactamase regulating signal transducer with metallopeptidase domain/tetratricopeptide (TPR) repeat protein
MNNILISGELIMNTILEQINSAGLVFVKFAVPMLAQSAVLIVVLLLADLLLRKKMRAVVRYWLWMLVLLKLVLPTTLSSPVSLGRFMGEPVATINLDAQQYSSPAVAVSEPKLDSPSAASPDIRLAASSAEPTHPAVLLTWQSAVLLLWLGVVCVMLLLLLQRAVFVCGLVRQSAEADGLMNDTLKSCCRKMGVRQTIGLKVSPNATSPAVCGLFRPVILLPQNLTPTLGSSRLRPVLMHELAHISRGDLWTNLAQTILQIIYFYNPLLWLANSVIRRIREQAVDEAVQVAMGANAPQYPQTLVDVAKMAFNRPALSLRLIGVVESKNALKGRIKRMLDRPIPKSAKLGVASILAVFIIGAVLLPMARAEKYTSGEKPFPETLSEEQKLYMEWTQEGFGPDPDKSEYTKLSESAKKELEEIWIEILKGVECEKYYDAINGLAAIKSRRAVEPLLKVAAERIEKDNRYRWQAVRALGIVDDDSVIPELIHLVYHYNQNTRFWAQISLVRLTGENFGADWQKWANWWNSQKGKPTCSTEKVEWTSNADWADLKKQKEMDEEFIEQLRENKKGKTDKSGDKAGQGPTVVGTSPAVYADDVSPELREITVTFDQRMMDKSWSWVRWDAPYPETVGSSPYYDDEKKTCTLPIKLEAGKAYLVAFNLEPYTGFVNTVGEPAKPYVLVFATKSEDGKPTPIPEELITKAKSVNERAETPYTQEVFDDIQPDGTILFKNTIRQINQSGKKITTEGFINSDFVHVTGMSDAKGRPLKFTSTHEEDIYRYEVTFNEPVLPGEVMEYTSEGTMEGLAKPVPASKDTFQYSMTHWPATDQPTRRVETYLLPLGAELISTTPEDMQRRTKNGRIELHVEKTIPTGGSITTAFQYRLTGVEGASKVSDKDKMASENLAAQGWALWQQRKLAEAEQVFEKAVLKDPANANAWNGLGWAQQNQGKALNAKASFEKCLEIQPEHAAALNGLGWIAKTQGKTDEAIAYWEKAIEAVPAATAALNGLATTYMELKDYDKAVKYYKMWLKVEPDNADAKAGLQKAKSEKTKGQPDQADEKENLLRAYEVNRSVVDFPEQEDFSTPEAAYAAINRVSASGEVTGWSRVSVKRLAEQFAEQKDRSKKKVDPEWAKVLLNATILEVHILSENRAMVIAYLPQQFSSKQIINPIDVRHLELEDGRWLNIGNDRFATIEQARAKFSR